MAAGGSWSNRQTTTCRATCSSHRCAPGEIVARAGKSVEQAMDEVKPAIQAVLGRLAAMAPAKVTVEFGLLLGAETGVIIAKGSGEVHFDVTLTWKRPEDGAGGHSRQAAGMDASIPASGMDDLAAGTGMGESPPAAGRNGDG
jgi:hypothetical protein